MANNPRLDIEIGAITNGLKKGLAEAREELRKFSKEASSSGIDVLKKQYNDARIEALKFATDIKASLAESLNNSKKYTEQAKQATESYKQSLLSAKSSVEQNKSAVLDSLSSLNRQKQATEEVKTETAQYRNELVKIALENKKNKHSVDVASDSLVGMRSRLNELRGIYDRLTQSQRNSVSVNKNLVPEIQRLNNAISSSEQATGRFQRNVGNYTKGIGNASGVTMEFSRIIQDLPYGMMGIGNNIQQLTANWQQYVESSKQASAAQGKTLTTSTLLKGALSSMISPASLLTLGIAAITSGWVLYEKWQQKSNKATKDAQKSLTDYIDTLNGVARAQANGQVNALKELTTIDQLYKATQNVNIPMEKRIENAKELVKQGGEVFKSVSAESIVAGEASLAYDKLTNSIRATAMAQAYMQKMTENSTAVLNNNIKALNDANEILRLNKQIQSESSTDRGGSFIGSVIGESAKGYDIQSLRNEVLDRTKSINELNKSNAEILKEQNMLQKGIDTQLEKGAKLTSDTNNNTNKIKNNISDINSLTNNVVKQGLSEFDAKLFDINKKYEEIYNKIKDPNILGLAKQNEIAEKLRLNIEKLAYTLNNSLQRNIQITGGVSLPTSLPELQQNSDRINRDRNANLTNDLNKEVKRSIVRGIGSAFTDLQSNIGNLGTNFYEVFSNVFNRLSGSIGGILTDVLGKTLGQSLVDKIEAGADIGALGSKLGQALIGGASIAGGLISSLVPKTSGVGQGLGGALSGAGMGAALGSIVPGVGTAIGAVAGGLIGALSGIFGASNAKKQEELQKKQLEEQEKQTALMERQAQLTYSSSVIGQQVNGGIVTSVDRDAYGNLVATLKGTDIKLALQRLDGGR